MNGYSNSASEGWPQPGVPYGHTPPYDAANAAGSAAPFSGQPVSYAPGPFAGQPPMQPQPAGAPPSVVQPTAFQGSGPELEALRPHELTEVHGKKSSKARAPQPTEKRRHPVRTAILALSFLVLAIALGLAGYIAWTYWNGQHEYDELTDYLQITDPESPPTLASFQVDWDGLRAINPDVVGWIYLPGTVINYPIAWRDGDDSYYTKHNFGRNSVGNFGAEYGCIALSSTNAPDWTDEANFLSGHHMRNGSMFALLAKFINSDEFNAHRTFYLLTPEGNFKLTSFSCNKIHGKDEETVIPNFIDKQDMTNYVQQKLDTSLVTADPPAPAAEDVEQIVMLYTCQEPDNRYRICVYTSVDEFVPAGSDKSLSSSLVDEGKLADVGAAVGERLL